MDTEDLNGTARWGDRVWAGWVSSVSWEVNRDGQSSPQREALLSQNLGQAALCSKHGETPYCKGKGLMRCVAGKDRPDWDRERQAEDKRGKKREKQG